MKSYTFKVANMRKEQDFTLYPYSGGDDIYLQSDHRFMRANLRTGEAVISGKNRTYSCAIDLVRDPVKTQLPDEIKLEIQEFLWNNEGREGNIKGVVFYENKELFIK